MYVISYCLFVSLARKSNSVLIFCSYLVVSTDVLSAGCPKEADSRGDEAAVVVEVVGV